MQYAHSHSAYIQLCTNTLHTCAQYIHTAHTHTYDARHMYTHTPTQKRIGVMNAIHLAQPNGSEMFVLVVLPYHALFPTRVLRIVIGL